MVDGWMHASSHARSPSPGARRCRKAHRRGISGADGSTLGALRGDRRGDRATRRYLEGPAEPERQERTGAVEHGRGGGAATADTTDDWRCDGAPDESDG